MAKTALIERELKREKLVAKYAAKHAELKAIADLCFNCHQCRMECPASVNIPKLVQEIKAQHVAGHGLTLSEKLLNRVDLLAAAGTGAAAEHERVDDVADLAVGVVDHSSVRFDPHWRVSL